MSIDGLYRRDLLLASGSSGEVWLASLVKNQMPIKEPDAIKISHASYQSVEARRAIAAVRCVAGINHPNILFVHSIGDYVGRLAIVTELAECNLFQVRKSSDMHGRFEANWLLRLLQDAANGLDFLTECGLTHAGITPFEMLVLNGSVKIGDFDSMHQTGRVIRHRDRISTSTAFCMSPEVRSGKAHRSSDQYSLAISYLWLYLGRLPPTNSSNNRFVLDAFPLAQQEVVQTALATSPGDRFDSCLAFVEALIASNC